MTFWLQPDDLAAHLGQSFDTNQTAQAQSALDSAQGAIVGFTRQKIEPVTNDAQELRGNWTDRLSLPQRPVTAVTSIVIRHGSVFVDDYPLTENSDYRWDRLGQVVRVSYIAGRLIGPSRGYWGGDRAVVDVVYSHGYAIIPPDVRSVCLAAAVRVFLNPAGVIREDVAGVYQVMYSPQRLAVAELTDSEKQLLWDYRRTPSSAGVS